MRILYPTRVPFITQRFGAKSPAYFTYHHGTDFRVWNDPKKEILAVDYGTVVSVDTNSTNNWYNDGKKGSVYGVHCVLRHFFGGEVYFTLYGHLNSLEVNEGQSVKAGQLLGVGGNTGKSRGEHLHFELRKGKNTWSSAINAEGMFVQPDEPPEWADEAWKWATKNELVNGKNPNDTITRAQMTTILHRFSEL